MAKVVINVCFGGFSLSDVAREWLFNHGATEDMEYGCCYMSRHNPLLVQCIEELGESSFGICAKLEVVELKDSRYRIDNYDGRESIQYPKDIQWIEV
jgi:hypothetical protein